MALKPITSRYYLSRVRTQHNACATSQIPNITIWFAPMKILRAQKSRNDSPRPFAPPNHIGCSIFSWVAVCVALLEAFVIINLVYFPIPTYEIPFVAAFSKIHRNGQRHDLLLRSEKQMQTTAILSAELHRCLDREVQLKGQMDSPDLETLRREPKLDGVAITLWMGSPKWFQNRYSMMLALMVSYLPPNWKVQIFHHPRKDMVKQALSYEGVRRLIAKGNIILTPLPEDLAKKKRKDILLSKWLWKAVAAERVITFGGTSVVCGNSPLSPAEFGEFDYIGGPSTVHGGLGGDAGISLRSRRFMISTAEGIARDTGFTRRDTGKEDTEISSFWNDQINNGSAAPFKIAKHEDTKRFAMNDLNGAEPNRPFGAIGTLAGLTDSQRTAAVDFCPELKLFYPSLIHPSCFGASPDPLMCFKYLCEGGGLRCDTASGSVSTSGKRGTADITIVPHVL